METITIEKIIKFDNSIDSIESISVDNELRYDLLEDDTYAKGKISINGNVNTLLGKKDFNEDVDVDIYAPFDKKLDKENFKIKVKDYSYVVNNKNLIVYIILEIDGIINSEMNNNSTLIEEMNTLNEINEEESMNRSESNTKEEVKVIEEIKEVKQDKVFIKENNKKDEISSNCSNDMFKLNDSYVIFHKFKLK